MTFSSVCGILKGKIMRPDGARTAYGTLRAGARREGEKMFREMRRKGQALGKEECEEILRAGRTGVLALSGDDGYPYPVPLNYVFAEGKIYFHCAKSGHKTDAIARSDKAGFCVVARDQVVPGKFTTYFQSVIAFGRIAAAEGEEAERGIRALAEKYAPDAGAAETEKEIAKAGGALRVLVFTVEHLSGKEAAELARERAADRRTERGKEGK